MAEFEIIASRSKTDKTFEGHPEFDIKMVSGTIPQGQSFILYDTHHPCRFHVTKVLDHGEYLTISVKESIPWDNRWVGAKVDTENSQKARRYGYNAT
jgi:hypothetical protein